MKKNYRFLLIDFVKNMRDCSHDESLRRGYAPVIDFLLSNVNIIDYLLFEKEYYK